MDVGGSIEFYLAGSTPILIPFNLQRLYLFIGRQLCPIPLFSALVGQPNLTSLTLDFGGCPPHHVALYSETITKYAGTITAIDGDLIISHALRTTLDEAAAYLASFTKLKTFTCDTGFVFNIQLLPSSLERLNLDFWGYGEDDAFDLENPERRFDLGVLVKRFKQLNATFRNLEVLVGLKEVTVQLYSEPGLWPFFVEMRNACVDEG